MRKFLSVTLLSLIFFGGNLLAEDWKLQKKLYDAIKNDDIQQIEVILAKNPSLAKKQIKYHRYPVLDAADLKSLKALKFLVEKGANINQKEAKSGNSVIHFFVAGRVGKEQLDDALNYFINEKKMKVDLKNKSGKTPFIYSCSYIRYYVPPASVMNPIVEAFQKHKANLNAQDKTGKTALYYLSSWFTLHRSDINKTDLEIRLAPAKFLANQKEVNVNITDKDKRTPLVAFLRYIRKMDDSKKVDYISCLMENGAKTNIKSKKKEKALKMVDKKSEAYKAMKKIKKKKR